MIWVLWAYFSSTMKEKKKKKMKILQYINLQDSMIKKIKEGNKNKSLSTSGEI